MKLLPVITCIALSSLVRGQSNLTIQIPIQDTYLLPGPFNNTFTQPFVNTTDIAADSAANSTIQRARNASFIVYDNDFLKIIGNDPTVQLLATSSNVNQSFAFEGGIWVPTLNQVWFTAFLDPTPGYLSILDLNTSTVFQPNITGDPLPNPNGGYYFDGQVYLTTFGDETTSPAVVAVDPVTYHATNIVNSYFGLPLNGPDDITVAISTQTNQTCMFFTDFFFNEEGSITGTWPGPSQLPYFVWSFNPSTQVLRPTISPFDVQVPNGIAVDRTNTILYVTDGPATAVFGRPVNHTFPSFAGIYQYDLGGTDGCAPQNKRLFAFARQGFANGIKIDDYGRVWTAEYEGIMVRDGTTGKPLGLFSAVDIILQNTQNPVNVRDVAPVANFALAGDLLVILAFDRIFGVKLAQPVVDPARYDYPN